MEKKITGGWWRRGYNGFRQKELTHWSLKMEKNITGADGGVAIMALSKGNRRIGVLKLLEVRTGGSG
ncbi:MAG: hypothetical protein LBT59_26220 [Clostridiales bacterium]|jgi:hypothetical protein|nr:hypothetical protein [Clostridiales bacterium]